MASWLLSLGQCRRTAAIDSKEDQGCACESNGIGAGLEIVAGCEVKGSETDKLLIEFCSNGRDIHKFY